MVAGTHSIAMLGAVVALGVGPVAVGYLLGRSPRRRKRGLLAACLLTTAVAGLFLRAPDGYDVPLFVFMTVFLGALALLGWLSGTRDARRRLLDPDRNSIELVTRDRA